MNRIELLGTVVGDPIEKPSERGGFYVFDLLVDTDTFSLAAFGRTKDKVKGLKNGQTVAVNGKLKNQQHTAKDGTTKSFLKIYLDDVMPQTIMAERIAGDDSDIDKIPFGPREF